MILEAKHFRSLERQHFFVPGIVQGIGLRRFGSELASERGVSGFTLNHKRRVTIEEKGNSALLEFLAYALIQRASVATRVDHLNIDALPLKSCLPSP